MMLIKRDCVAITIVLCSSAYNTQKLTKLVRDAVQHVAII